VDNEINIPFNSPLGAVSGHDDGTWRRTFQRIVDEMVDTGWIARSTYRPISHWQLYVGRPPGGMMMALANCTFQRVVDEMVDTGWITKSTYRFVIPCWQLYVGRPPGGMMMALGTAPFKELLTKWLIQDG
jgi:hypothetical protein